MTKPSVPATRRLILLPGFDGTGLLFEPIRQYLEHYFQLEVVSFDNSTTFDDYIDRVLTQIGDQPCCLLAESFSGPIALRIAANHADKIDAVILSTTFIETPYKPICRIAAKLPDLILQNVLLLKTLVKTLCLNNTHDKRLANKVINIVKTLPAKTIKQRLQILSSYSSLDSQPTGDISWLCLHATDDRIVGEKQTRELIAMLSKPIVTEINGPHLLLQAAPKTCANTIIKFHQQLNDTDTAG